MGCYPLAKMGVTVMGFAEHFGLSHVQYFLSIKNITYYVEGDRRAR